jgi:hypothetical protein
MMAAPPPTPSPEPPDFSLILGGPLYQLLRRARLSGDVLELMWRRVIVLALVTWLPLLVLSLAQGRAWSGSIKLPFLLDVDMHARFLLALPLLVVAELVVHQRMRVVVEAFLKRGLVPDAARGEFEGAVAAAMRLRNSVLAEVLLIAFVYGFGVLVLWRSHTAIDVTTWYGKTLGGELQPTWAGWWFGCVSLPIFQFVMLRWYFRLFIWGRFLWHVSRIDLQLVPTHPDRAGGLGFLSNMSYAFAPLLAGQGVMFAGVIADKIFYAGVKLTDFKMELIALVVGGCFSLCSRRCLSSSRFSLALSAWGSRNTADSPSVTSASLTRNGCAAARRLTSRWWAAATSNRWPIWAIASRS